MGFFEFLDNVVNIIGDLADKQVISRNISDFNGSQSMYDDMMNQFLYVDNNIDKAFELENSARNRFPNTNFQHSYSPSMPLAQLFFGKKVASSSVISGIMTLAHNNAYNNINDVLDDVIFLASSGFLCELMGFSNFNGCKFIYEYNKDMERCNDLASRRDRASNPEVQQRYQNQINQVIQKYNGWLGYNGFFLDNLIDIMQIEQIPNNIINYAPKYCTWMDDIYVTVLNNAIRLHNASYLNNLYPTQDQVIAVRAKIQDKLVNDTRNACGNMNAIYRTINTAKQQAARMRQIVEQQQNNTGLGNAVLTGVLTFLNPVLGVANGARSVYGSYQNEQSLDSISREIEATCQSFINESDNLTRTLYNSIMNSMTNFISSVGNTYLTSSINDVMNQLRQNGIQPYNISEYLKY